MTHATGKWMLLTIYELMFTRRTLKKINIIIYLHGKSNGTGQQYIKKIVPYQILLDNNYLVQDVLKTSQKSLTKYYLNILIQSGI